MLAQGMSVRGADRRKVCTRIPGPSSSQFIPDDREGVLADLESKETGQPFDHEYRIVRPDGSVRWIWDRGYPVRTEAGQVTRFVGVAIDITARKLAEEALRE